MDYSGSPVFRSNLIGQGLLVAGVFAFVTVFVVNFDEWWIYLFYLMPLLLLVSAFKSKIVLEEKKLVQYMVFGSEEVEYKEIAEVKMRKTQSVDNDGKRTTSSDFYLLDDEGDLFFTIGVSGLGGKGKRGEFFRLLKEKNPEIVLDGYCQGLMELD